MLHSLHLDMPVLMNICGGMGVGVMTPVGDVIECDGEICCCCAATLVASTTAAAAAALDDNRSASSMLCFTSICGGMTFNAGSDKRSAMSAGNNGRISSDEWWWWWWWVVDDEFDGEIEMLPLPPPRGLCERRFGEGVSGGLPGSDGAQTICSGVIESPLTDMFSLPSMMASNSMRK